MQPPFGCLRPRFKVFEEHRRASPREACSSRGVGATEGGPASKGSDIADVFGGIEGYRAASEAADSRVTIATEWHRVRL
jgi:hypothetical protein